MPKVRGDEESPRGPLRCSVDVSTAGASSPCSVPSLSPPSISGCSGEIQAEEATSCPDLSTFDIRYVRTGATTLLNERILQRVGDLRNLTRTDEEARKWAAATGGIVFLVHLAVEILCKLPATSWSVLERSIFQESVTALRNISLDEDAKRRMLQEGCVGLACRIMSEASIPLEAREDATVLTVSLTMLEASLSSFFQQGVLDGLLRMLTSGTSDGQKDACKCLHNLSAAGPHRLVDHGFVPLLLERVEEQEANLGEKALCVLASLCKIQAGRQAVVDAKGGLQVLLDVLWFTEKPSAKEQALVILCRLAEGSPEAVTQLKRQGAMLALIQLDATGMRRGIPKAERLLFLLGDDAKIPNATNS